MSKKIFQTLLSKKVDQLLWSIISSCCWWLLSFIDSPKNRSHKWWFGSLKLQWRIEDCLIKTFSIYAKEKIEW